MPRPARYVNWVNVLLVVATVGVVALLIIGALTARKTARTSEDIIDTFQVHQEIRSVLAAMKDAESGAQGFLMTGHDTYLKSYQLGLETAEKQIASLTAHSAVGAVSPERLSELQRLVREKRLDMENIIAARQSGPDAVAFETGRQIMLTDRGRSLMQQIRTVTSRMLEARETEMDQLQGMTAAMATQHQMMIGMGLLLTVGMLLAATAFIRMDRAERILAATRLQTDRSRLQAVIDSSMDAVVAIDQQYNVVMFNPIAEAVFQRNAADVIGHSCHTLIPQRYHSVFDSLLSATGVADPARTQVNDGGVVWGLRNDRTEFPAEVVVSRSIINGQVLFTVILRDVTERETGRTRMREQAAILSRVRDAIHIRDLDGRIQTWNEGAQRLFGWEAEAAIGQPGATLLQAGSQQTEREILDEVLARGVWIGERDTKTRDGRELVIESHRSLIVDAAGQPTSLLVIDNDITEEKRRKQMEHRSQRLESIGTLTSGIAHDLNNVLTPITMGAKLLRRNAADPRQTGLLDTICASAERGAAMIRQLLTFAGGSTGPREVVDLSQLIDEACSILHHALTQSVCVKTDVAESLWSTSGDFTELSQVLMNLAINARDAMPDGGTLTFEAQNVTLSKSAPALGLTPGKYVRVSVVDTGTGIPPACMDRIFDPFFTTKEQGHGTGLGLATCMGIVKSHDGNMSVYSELNTGTKFTIYLPAHQSTVDLTVELAVDVRTAGLPVGGGQQILVVDDEEFILQMARATLESCGYRPLTAIGGAAALALFSELHTRIDLVIVDMMMPDIDGPTTITALKEIDPHVKIVASSGLRKPAHGTDNIAGSDRFLPKPYSDEELLQAINDVLNGTAAK